MFSNFKNEDNETEASSEGTVRDTPKKYTQKKKEETKLKRKGIVLSIAKGMISIEENGFGTRIPYDATIHANLTKGDPIEF